MNFFKLLTAALVLNLSPIALGDTMVDCEKAKFYSGTENTRNSVNYSKVVSQSLKSSAHKKNIVRPIYSPSKQTR